MTQKGATTIGLRRFRETRNWLLDAEDAAASRESMSHVHYLIREALACLQEGLDYEARLREEAGEGAEEATQADATKP